MNHAEIDPTLRPAEPPREGLEDGFSPPAVPQDPPQPLAGAPAQPALGAKSPF